MSETEKLRRYVDEQFGRINDGKITAAWYNPATSVVKDKDNTGIMLEPQTIYVGDVGGRPTWESPVLNVPNYWKAKQLYSDGKASTEEFKELTAKAIYPEWEGKFAEAFKTMKTRTAGTVTTSDFSAISVVNVLNELLGTQWRVHTLEQAVWSIPTPSLHLDIDSYTRFTAFQDIPEGATTPTSKGAFSRQSIDLTKDVANLAFTDEVQMKGYDHNIYSSHIQNAVNDLKRIKAKKIATALESAADVSGGDWGSYSSGYSANDPYDNIGTIVDLIEANDGNADTIATADKGFRDFIGNTRVKGNAGGTPNNQFGPRVIGNIPGLQGFTWYIDQELTATIATVFDKRAIVLAQGPVRTAQYRDEQSGIDGYITRDWNAVKVVQSGLIRNLTGITA